MQSFLKFQSEWSEPETPAYAIYPEKLSEPYRTSRFEVGEQMYSILGIERDDKEGRFKQMHLLKSTFLIITFYTKYGVHLFTNLKT